jgi:hypothetical protein
MSDFPEGFSIVIDHQTYRPIGVREHIKLDGSPTRLIDFETECPTCGATFQCTSRMSVESLTRRCSACKAPGKRVSTERRRNAAQAAE